MNRTCTWAALFLLIAALSMSVAAVPEIRNIEHVETFVVEGPTGAVTRQVTATIGNLYFLQRVGKNEARLVVTDHHGRVKRTMSVSPSTVQAAIDSKENIKILEVSRQSAILKELAPSGAIMREQSLAHKLNGILQVGDRLLALKDTEVTDSVEGRQQTILSHITSPYRASELLGNRGVVVTSLDNPRMFLIQPSLRVLGPFMLNAPEIQPSELPKNVAPHLTIYSVASTTSGDVVCAVSPYPDGAAVVLVFDLGGTLKYRLRAVLPKTIVSPRGMLASHIAVNGTSMFIASASHGQVARYILPNQ